MKKQLTEIIEEELFNLHKAVWSQGTMHPYIISCYKKRVIDLANQEYHVQDHLKFVKYYMRMMERKER